MFAVLHSMNRPIKFRAWDKVAKKMVYEFGINASGTIHNLQPVVGELHKLLNVHMAKIDSLLQGTFYLIDIGDWYAMDNFIAMQFTGIKDSKGIEIFESDILSVPMPFGKPLSVVVSYYVDSFRTTVLNKRIKKNYLNQEIIPVPHKMNFKDWQKSEIIGNIYQTPNILSNP